MQSTTAYLISGIVALVLLIVAALASIAINYEGGSRPKDPKKRRIWFWIIAALNPVLTFLLGCCIFKPEANIMIVKRYMNALSIGTGLGFLLYIVLGFVLSKIYKNGKIGHWF